MQLILKLDKLLRLGMIINNSQIEIKITDNLGKSRDFVFTDNPK